MYKNILVPVAFDADHDPSAALAAAKVLADQGGKVTLIHVLDAVPAYVAAQVPKEVRIEARDKIKHDLKEKATIFPDAEIVVIDGHAGTAIVEYADDHDIDLIVVASHRPGLQDYFLGSTAARVVRHANCAVHVTR
ncbi:MULTISPECIES: universal stress protein [Cohaesibacter]|uniref:universal stress protein n=1 Tax=Cohaesibacter TaxID=655352 RepID=UPI000DE803AD|nr:MULTISPECIES: universal stress protein [Cohaesibacter]TLP48234.1 universal stress protein [Cohaesibacter sp. CAU 1516]